MDEGSCVGGGGANAAVAVCGRLAGADRAVDAEVEEEEEEEEEDAAVSADGITWRLLTCAVGAGMRTSSRNLRNGSSDGWLYHAQNSSKLSRPSLRARAWQVKCGWTGRWAEILGEVECGWF